MKPRPYSKQELAQLYFPYSGPRTACNHLMRWINNCPPLVIALSRTNYVRTAKLFTPLQVRLIVEHLGEP